MGAPLGYAGFPGMQSVSLDKSNLALLREKKVLMCLIRVDFYRARSLVLSRSLFYSRSFSFFLVLSLAVAMPCLRVRSLHVDHLSEHSVSAFSLASSCAVPRFVEG